jgi:uncharacterized protein
VWPSGLPFDLTPLTTAYMAVVLFGAAFVRGYSGFGFAALVITGAALVTDPFHFVPVVLIVDIFLTIAQARGIWPHIAWRRVAGLFGGALLGVPLGLTILMAAGLDLARAVISVFVLLMCAALWSGWKWRGHAATPAHLGAGFVSGIANAAAVGGLPVAVFFAAQTMSATVFRATLIAYFTALDLWTVPMMAARGMISADTLWASVLAMPVLLLGVWLGSRQFLSANPTEFRRFAILLLAGLASLGLIKSVI